jgi:hypothetical protein
VGELGLVNFVERLEQAYPTGIDFAFGIKNFSADEIILLLTHSI